MQSLKPDDEWGRGELYDDGRKLASYDEDRGQWYHHAGRGQRLAQPGRDQEKSFAGLSDFNEASFAFAPTSKAR